MASVELVIPVLNEEHALPGCLDSLREFLMEHLQEHRWQIVIVDNGSTDGTLQVAQCYAERYPQEVRYLHMEARGRGRALKRAWTDMEADLAAYMDVDLSTGLDALPELVNAIAHDGYHIAYGSRLAKTSRTTRGLKREVISQGYNLLVKWVMRTSFSDAQCGFKAISKSAARVLMPVIINNNWFFDTEMLVIAEKRGFRIKEVPVAWSDDPDSRVKIFRTAMEDIQGLARLRLGGVPEVIPPENGAPTTKHNAD